MKYIAIFASGTGSNAKKIIEYFAGNEQISVAVVISNKPAAPVLEMARKHGIDTLVINRKDFYETENLLHTLQQYPIDFIVLAGFLWLVPQYLVGAYERRMLNIHPALLPKYGGKGMYGMNVHRAVKAAAESETGITIHYVNEQYDDGAIVFQASCPVAPGDSPEDIAAKVRLLEHQHFAPIIEKTVNH